jgi:hypothetical protein
VNIITEVHPNDHVNVPFLRPGPDALDILDSKSIQLIRGRPELLEFF